MVVAVIFVVGVVFIVIVVIGFGVIFRLAVSDGRIVRLRAVFALPSLPNHPRLGGRLTGNHVSIVFVVLVFDNVNFIFHFVIIVII